MAAIKYAALSLLFLVVKTTCDVIVLPNVPKSFWRELVKVYGGNDTIEEALYKADELDSRADEIRGGSNADDYVKSLTATVTVWCIASFMILISLAAVAFFILNKRRQIEFAQVPDKDGRL